MKSTERVQLPAKAKFVFFCRQHLATLPTPTIRSIKCKQSPVYGVFWPLLPHPSTDCNKTRTWSSLSPSNFAIKFNTNPSTTFLVIVVTDRHRHKPTPVKTYSLTFAGRMMFYCILWFQFVWYRFHFCISDRSTKSFASLTVSVYANQCYVVSLS